MYPKIKIYLFFILLFNSFASYCQLQYDSLVKICTSKFNIDKHIYSDRLCKNCKVSVSQSYDDTFGRYIMLEVYNLDSSDTDYDKLKELYPNTNPSYIIPTSPYFFSFNTEYLVYMIDIYTGKILSVENYETFNKIINSSKQKLYNLEKCTLFLLLNHKGCYGLSDLLYGYPSNIKQSKPFSELQSVFGRKRRSKIKIPEWLRSNIQYDKDHSNSNNIVIYELLSDTSEYLACRYQFLFDFTDNISAINKEYIK